MAIIVYMRDVLGEEPIFDSLANSQIYKLLTMIYMYDLWLKFCGDD